MRNRGKNTKLNEIRKGFWGKLFQPLKINTMRLGLMDKIQAKKLHKPLFYLPLQAFEKMNKKSVFTVVVK